jgi:toxin ParE1/3/4
VKKARLVFSDAAITDILEQADWYRVQSGSRLARRWERAVTSTIQNVVRYPSAGSLCAFQAPELTGTRRVGIPKFPKHLVFYRSEGEEIFILRVVHGARDLERLFS